MIGTVASSDIRLSHQSISPVHAVLELHDQIKSGSHFGTIYDLASASGIYVNGKKVVTSPLQEGDRLGLGIYDFIITSERVEKTKAKNIVAAGGRKLFFNPEEDFSPLLLQNEYEVEEIFDYTPTNNQQAIEVIMSWKDNILNVGHFVDRQSITLGTTRVGPKVDFGIPPLLPSSPYSIIRSSGSAVKLCLDSKMAGVIRKKEELKSVEEMRNTVVPDLHGYQIPFEKGDFAKIQIGDLDFYFSFTAAPPKVKRRRVFERDPLFIKVFFTSMVLSAIMVLALLNTRISRVVESEELPKRIVTILYQPEKKCALF